MQHQPKYPYYTTSTRQRQVLPLSHTIIALYHLESQLTVTKYVPMISLDPSSSPAAIVPPIVGAVVLVLGTGSAVYLNAKKRQQAKREKIQMIRKQQQHPTATLEAAADGRGVEEEVGSNNDNRDKGENGDRTLVAVAHGNPANAADDALSSQDDPPLLLPTVSAATNDFGSFTYSLFVVTACVHAVCLLVTCLLQRDVATSSVVVDPDQEAYASTMGTLLVMGGAVGAGAIVLTSLIPARGRGTVPHIAFGFVFFEAAVCWMIWTCMLTVVIEGSSPPGCLLVIRCILTSLACVAMISAFIHTYKTMKLRGKEGVEDLWSQLVHRTAICQMTFGFVYAVFLGLVVIDF